MKFAFAGEGLTDHKVVKNLLIGFFNDKDLTVNKLRPENTEPFGWGNLFKYLATDKFRESFPFSDYIIVQIDSGTCADWHENITHIGDDTTGMEEFIEQIIAVLISKIGEPFYSDNQNKIIIAICVHDIECWLLPFHEDMPAKYGKIVNCFNTLEQVAKKKGISLNQKNYGNNYDDLCRDMRKQKTLMANANRNPSLAIFINKLIEVFHKEPESTENNTDPEIQQPNDAQS